MVLKTFLGKEKMVLNKQFGIYEPDPRFLLILIPFILLLSPEWLLILPIIDLDGEKLL
jgi:hypothetical protein